MLDNSNSRKLTEFFSNGKKIVEKVAFFQKNDKTSFSLNDVSLKTYNTNFVGQWV
jgi:uncharacterized protein YkuJ